MRCGTEMTNTTGGNYICPKCNMSINDLVNRTQNCDIPSSEGFGVWQGWVCPKCGKVLAPWRSECDCYKRDLSTITTTNTNVDAELEKLFELNDDRVAEMEKFYKENT